MRKLCGAMLIIGGLALLMLTAIAYASIDYWMPRIIDIPGSGKPYAIAALVCGAFSSIVSFYSAYTLFTRWNSRVFLLLLQVLCALFAFCAIISSILFIIKTDLFGLEGAVGVTIAVFLAIPLIYVIELVKNNLDTKA